MTVGIINYGMGNIFSLKAAINAVAPEIDTIYSEDSAVLSKCDKLILPGVGNFKSAANKLTGLGLRSFILDRTQKAGTHILGICLGMQLLFEFSEEGGGAKGLGLIEGKVGKFPESTPKIPHIGFNEARPSEHSKLFADLQHLDFYFVHSYRVVDVPEKVDSFSICSYGGDFIASIEYQNIFGTQFHPEKSQKNGLKLLKNFLSLK